MLVNVEDETVTTYTVTLTLTESEREELECWLGERTRHDVGEHVDDRTDAEKLARQLYLSL